MSTLGPRSAPRLRPFCGIYGAASGDTRGRVRNGQTHSDNARMLRLLPPLVVAIATSALAEPLPVQPTRVSDGDTFTARVEEGHTARVRLAGCDTPERGQAFGRKATEALKAILWGGPVVADCYKQDRYGRGVCRVSVDSRDVCLTLIQGGYAWHYTAYASEQTPEQLSAYAAAQSDAEEARRGLWVDPAPVPPWEWRKLRRNSGRNAPTTSEGAHPSEP